MYIVAFVDFISKYQRTKRENISLKFRSTFCIYLYNVRRGDRLLASPSASENSGLHISILDRYAFVSCYKTYWYWYSLVFPGDIWDNLKSDQR